MESWQTDRRCPHCDLCLFAAIVDAVEVDACGRCGGVWLFTTGTERVLTTFHRGALDLAELAHRRMQAPAASGPGAPALPCPICRGSMERKLEADGAVIVDRCPQHGTWFDGGELKAATAALLRKRERQGAYAVAGVGAAAVAGTVAGAAAARPDVVEKVASTAGDVAVAVGESIVEGVVTSAVEGVASAALDGAVDLVFGMVAGIFE